MYNFRHTVCTFVQLYTVFKITQCEITQEYLSTFCGYFSCSLSKNSPHLKKFPPPPVVAVVTNIRYVQNTNTNTQYLIQYKYQMRHSNIKCTNYLIPNVEYTKFLNTKYSPTNDLRCLLRNNFVAKSTTMYSVFFWQSNYDKFLKFNKKVNNQVTIIF